jgi:hypothetical protein
MKVTGSDRMLFSIHYPFENMEEAAELLDNAPINESDRAKARPQERVQFVPPAHTTGRCLPETQSGTARAGKCSAALSS